MDAAELVLRAGYRLDRYELLCPIASGGMATVWLARLQGKRGFEKLFAVKTIRTELVDDPRFQEMFLDEARIASGIQHPNVAQILDLGEQQDVLFIVMEWVDGDSLAKVRKLITKCGHRLPVGVVLRVLADACAGLHAAHEIRDGTGLLEIVHRDVSLHNILVGSAGEVKVIDFGIAKAHNRMQGETRTGVVKGKIHYMAPEQVQKGRRVDRRADVWALGVCLHELMTGRLPYEGDDDVEVIRKLMTDEAPPPADGLPDRVTRVLEHSLVLDVDARFPTAAAMQRALEAAMNDMDQATTSEDVAAFLRSELPELAQRRKDIVQQAVEEARERNASSGETLLVEPDVAFAPTLMSDPQEVPQTRREGHLGPGDRGVVALTRKKDRRPAPPTALQPGVREASDALDQEPIRIPKTSRAWLWITLLVLAGGGAAAYRWPVEARAYLSRMGIGGGQDADPQVVPETRGTASAPTAALAGPQPSVSAAVPLPPASVAAEPLSPASPGRSAPSASGSASPTPSRGGTTHHTWPVVRAPSAPAGGAVPSASAPAPAPTPWSPYKEAPPPVASDVAPTGAATP
jgi:serine/threonine protein kinase